MLPTLVQRTGRPCPAPWAETRPDPRWAARPRPQTPLWRRVPTAHGPRPKLGTPASAVSFPPADERGPWSAGPGALGPLSGTCPCFHGVGGRRPRGPSARGAWGQAGVLSPGGWFRVADCPAPTLRRLLQGHRGDVRPADLCLRAGRAPRSKARLQAGRATRPTDLRPRSRRPTAGGRCPAAPGRTLPASSGSVGAWPHSSHLGFIPRAASPVCLGPSLPEDTGHWVRSAPS